MHAYINTGSTDVLIIQNKIILNLGELEKILDLVFYLKVVVLHIINYAL